MPYLRAFGCYLPSEVLTNSELAPRVAADPAWLQHVTGIEERRFAAPNQKVSDLAVFAARDCLQNGGMSAREIGFVVVASGSAERRFPGPAASIAAALGIPGVPAIDLPMASAGSLFGISLASDLAPRYGNMLVIGAEIMSRVLRIDAAGRDTAVLFGDGAGACVVSRDGGFAQIKDSLLASDGDFGEALQLYWDAPLYMDGRTVILHAARKLPRTIHELLEKNGCEPAAVDTYLLHQANLNLITRVAHALDVPEERFFQNLSRYGNTSSASLLIAAAEWQRSAAQKPGSPIVLAAFGAGFHWGALLAYTC